MCDEILQSVNSVRLLGLNRLRYQGKTVLSKVIHRLYLLAKDREEIVDAISNLKKDLAVQNVYRTGIKDHYTEEHELDTWRKYKAELSEQSITTSEVVFRAIHVRDELIRIIEREARVENIINFGCSYGWLENELASRFPHVRVWGIDRCELAMSLNRNEFKASNCMFVASDIFQFIRDKQGAFKNSIFCHVNVGVYFLPAFLKKLYEAVWATGNLYVVLFEPSGVSRQTGDYYRYSRKVKESLVFRGPMLLHNYPNLLKEAGYEVIDGGVYAPPHAHKDFRSVGFTARRRE